MTYLSKLVFSKVKSRHKYKKKKTKNKNKIEVLENDKKWSLIAYFDVAADKAR